MPPLAKPDGHCRGALRGVAAAAMLLWLGACAMQQPQPAVVALPTPAPVELPKPKALSDEAGAALVAAEQSVIEARIKRSLWTRALEHLDLARAAAKALDSSATLHHAREVVALCTLSIEQLKSPPVRW